MTDFARLLDPSAGFAGPHLVIAEIAQAHDGSLGTAHALVDAAADAGAGAVKFQTHIASAESTREEPWRVKFSRQDASRFDYWRRMEFTMGQWAELAGHCAERGITFLSSPFSVAAVELLERVGMPAYKVASGEVGNPELLDAILGTGKPVLLSSGMSTLAELDNAVMRTRGAGVPFCVMQCTTAYPAEAGTWGLAAVPMLSERFGCVAGYSDHSGGVAAGLAAAALGARIVEVHLTLSRQAFGPDVPASVTPDELALLASGVSQIRTDLAAGADKDRFAERVADLRATFGRSWALAADLTAGTTIDRDHLVLKKPGTGIQPSEIDRILGHTLVRDVSAEHLLTWEDLA